MTNTEAIKPSRWTRTGGIPSGSTAVYQLLRKAAPAAEVADLFTALTKIRGAHRVEIVEKPGDWSRELGAAVPSGWFQVAFRGTERAVVGARNLLMLSALQEVDPNADHDHAACIASAAAMGVPARWAHTPETYLSS